MVFLRITLRVLTLGIVVCHCAAALSAEEPDDPHVLFSFNRQEAEREQVPAGSTTATASAVAQGPAVQQAAIASQPAVKVDPAVATASHVEAETEQRSSPDRRRLAPVSRSDLLPHAPAENERGKLPFEIPHVDSLGTAGAGLVLVVGLFLLCVSLMRRGGPNPSTPLPHDAVAVLGRLPLTPKQFAHLIQVGNKLVLVSITGDRTDTITEITEPAEVERLLMLCMKGSKQSSSAEFQKLLAQMAKEPARGFLGREAAPFSRTARG